MCRGFVCKLKASKVTSAKSRLRLTFALVFASIFASGCAYTGNLKDYVHNGFKVGPEYCKPAAPVAGAWIDSYNDRIRSELPDNPEWWTVFNDPILTQLVYGAYQQNLPLREAGLRVVQSRAQLGIATGSFFPQAQELFGSFNQTTLSNETSPAFFPRGLSTWQNGASVAWEMDLWGKFRRNIEAADATMDASIEDYDEILICLIADTASTYVGYRVIQQQLEYARANVEIQEGSLKIADARFKAGQTSELDLTQAKTQLRSTKRLIPVFENQLRLANNSLCILLGIPPIDLSAELGSGPIPTSPANVAIGVPANLLRRRPDVLSAERQVAAQSARIGVAAADWFPSVSIAGSLGYAARNFGDLYSSQAFTGSISPQFNWPILNYGRILNNVRVQDALFQQAAVAYQQTVLSANTEAENAINSFIKAQEALIEAQAAVDAAKRSVDLAVTQYTNGAIDYNRVFNLQLNLVTEQNTLASTQGQIPTALIDIYKALGGGWQIRYGNGARATQTVVMEEGFEQPLVPKPESLPPVPEDEEEVEEDRTANPVDEEKDPTPDAAAVEKDPTPVPVGEAASSASFFDTTIGR